MPLELLLVLVIGGIAGLALLMHLIGLSRSYVIADKSTARALWLRHYPRDRIDAIHIAADRKAALIETDNGPGLLRSFGADTIGHRIDAAIPEIGGLRIAFGEFAAPDAHVSLRPEELALWQAALKDLPR